MYFNVRLGENRLACLVIVGVLPGGRKEVIALDDGYCKATESWTSVPRNLKHHGLPTQEPAVGDGNLGFWAALRQVHSEAQDQRCWKHKIANLLDELIRQLQPQSMETFHKITKALDRESALEEITNCSEEYGALYPKAIETLTRIRIVC